MAFDETFRPHPNFDEVEVFTLTGQAKTVRELQPSNFAGPVAEWANERMHNFGETIVPRHVYIEPTASGEEHRVAWIYHDGLDLDAQQSFCMHHVACDCSQAVDNAETPKEKQEIIGNCQPLINVLNKRAWFINTTYGMDNVFSSFYDPERPAYEQTSEAESFAVSSIMYMLEHDYRHPESWMANVESGWTLINLVAKVMNLHPEDVQWFTELLKTQDLVETDGVVISLSQRFKDGIETERKLRELEAEIDLDLGDQLAA